MRSRYRGSRFRPLRSVLFDRAALADQVQITRSYPISHTLGVYRFSLGYQKKRDIPSSILLTDGQNLLFLNCLSGNTAFSLL